MADVRLSPGRSLSWKDLTRFATGEGLSAKTFAADFQGD
jgi:peptidyl-dipeptidase A